MKIVIMVTVVAIAMGSLFHEDIVQSFSAKGSGSQAGIPAVKSAGNLGTAMNNNMQSIGSSLSR
jgi:hypothetical protein